MGGYKDYRAVVDGTVVGEGPADYLCDALGISNKSFQRWLYDETHRVWGSIDPIPRFWLVDGKMLQTSEACAVLDCTPSNLAVKACRGRVVTRARVEPWHLPPDVISTLIQGASEWHKSRNSA